MKTRSDACMVGAYQDVYEYLESVGQKPTLNVTDKEASEAVQNYIKSKDVDWQLVEPDNHRVNAAERAIQTFKNHFLAGLATVDKTFPLQLWCYLLVQAEMTLNMLRTSRKDPTKSACEELEGKFNYNKTPLAPPGTKALIYEATARRASWAPHAVDGWYIGPVLKHYQCGRYFTPHTRATRITSSAKLFPTHCRMPTISEGDETIIAAEELVKELSDGSKKLNCEQKLKHAKVLKQLTNILKHRPPQRVVPETPQRVGVPSTSNDSPQRVGVPSTSNDTTAPRIIRTTRHIHQRHTRSNKPMETIPEEEDTGSEWYDNERPPRNKKKKNKTRTMLAPDNVPEEQAPVFQEIHTTEDSGNQDIPMITQDDNDIINEIPRGLGFPMKIPVPRPTPETLLKNKLAQLPKSKLSNIYIPRSTI